MKAPVKASIAFAGLSTLLAAMPFATLGGILGHVLTQQQAADGSLSIPTSSELGAILPIVVFIVAVVFCLIPGFLAGILFFVAIAGVRKSQHRKAFLLLLAPLCGFISAVATLLVLSRPEFPGSGTI